MIKVLGNPFPCLFYSNDLNCLHHSHECINVNPALKSCLRCTVMHGDNMVSMSLVNIPRLNSVVQSVRAMDFRTHETLLKCEENEAFELLDDEEGLEESLREWKSPPWGEVTVHEEHSFQYDDINQPKISAGMSLVNEGKVHFLEELDETTLSKRILILSRRNRVRSALELFRSMKLTGLLPSLHASNSLLACLLRNGLLDDGLRIFEFMKKNKLSTGHTYSLVLKAVANALGFRSALDLFATWEQGFEVEGFDAIVYNTMISACGKENNWVEAARIRRLMETNGYNATQVTYCLLISTFVHCNQNELAMDTYIEMVQHNFKPNTDTMQAIIGASSKEGKWDFALRVFQDMLRCGLQPNSVACNALIHALGKAKKVTLAFRVYNVMKSLGHPPDVYTWNALLDALYGANRYGDAIQLFEFIKRAEKPGLNVYIYNTCLMSCSKLGLWDRALQILWEMEAAGLSIPTTSYNIVIGACEMARKPKIALQVYEHMIHQKHSPDTFTYLSLIRCCIWGSLWDEVEGLLNKSAPNVSVYNTVIQGMCLRGKPDLAKKLYIKMREEGFQADGKTRALMLQNLPSDYSALKNRSVSRFRKRHNYKHYHYK